MVGTGSKGVNRGRADDRCTRLQVRQGGFRDPEHAVHICPKCRIQLLGSDVEQRFLIHLLGRVAH